MTNIEPRTEQPLRWGVLSSAKIGRNAVIPAIAAASNAEFVAIASREVSKAEPVAARYPSARVFNSYEALLADPSVEAVYIPLPNSMHLDWTIRAAEAGKHILCEKPLGLTAAEVTRMMEACERAGVLLMEAFMYRLHPQIVWARQQIADGAIGQVRMVRGAFSFDIRTRPGDIRLQGALGGGSLMDVGCYPLNFCRMIYGEGPREVAARVDVPTGGTVETATAAVLDFGGGRLGVIDSSFTQPRHQFLDVVGDAGRMLLPHPFTPGMGDTWVRIEHEETVTEQHFAPIDQYRLEVEYFGECVRGVQTPAELTPEDALEQAQAIESIYAAAGYTWPRPF